MSRSESGHISDLPLTGVRIIEFASFVAGPLAGVTLSQLGADVIRIDPIGGAADYGRWPLAKSNGASLFWASLNRGKRSVEVDVRSPAGRELVLDLMTAPGPANGILLDNQSGSRWLTPETLRGRRADIIHVRIQGTSTGRPAVDYTVNAEVGIPDMTGPVEHGAPVNHVLPAWDLLTGMTAVTGLLAALRRRDLGGQGSYVPIALRDVALAGVAGMGWLTEAEERDASRPRTGNYLYGSFGVDFSTSDAKRVMVVALTGRQWKNLVTATGTGAVMEGLAGIYGVDFCEESHRYAHRETLAAVLRPWFEARPFKDIASVLDSGHVLWSRYRSAAEVAREFRGQADPSVLVDVEQPGLGHMVSAVSPMRFDDEYGGPSVAPALGAHTDEVLEAVLGLEGAHLNRLRDSGVIR